MSDSEYSVNDTPTVEANSAAQSCPANGGCCCANCPLSKLRPENLEATLTRHSTFIDEFQGAIFYRRPIAFIALLVSVNLTFFFYRTLNLNFYSLLCLLAIIYIAVQLIPSAIISSAKGVLFPGQLEKGILDDPSRVRDTNELVSPINKALAPLFGFLQILNTLSKDQSVTGLLIYGSIFFCLFCVTASVDFFWPIVILTNLALILPGVLSRPQVVPYVKKLKEHIHAQPDEAQPESQAEAQPQQQQPQAAQNPNISDIADKLKNAANNAANSASEALNNASNQANDALNNASNQAGDFLNNASNEAANALSGAADKLKEKLNQE